MSAIQEDHRLLLQITPRNILSYGSKTEPVPLENLNILIGPNGSGKSNFIETITLLRACPKDAETDRDPRAVVRRGGGVDEWIWKGAHGKAAYVEAIVRNPSEVQPLRHELSFRSERQVFRLDDECIENRYPDPGESEPYFYYHYQHGQPVLNVTGERRRLRRETVEIDRSILSQRKDPDMYPEVSYLGSVYEKIRVYREWAFGRNTVFREPQRADMRNDFLEEDFSNLGLFLNRLRRLPKAKRTILESLCDLYEGLSDFDVSIEGGTVQVFFTEGDYTIPATRLSDGTLRYLCLLAVLCDPDPPPLICIEEPELGLHPDILPKVGDLLISASERTQLIVTTHSDILVDVMTERPQAVIVCEKHDGQTVMRRLNAESLASWLDKYRLGELWTRGELGGTRWGG